MRKKVICLMIFSIIVFLIATYLLLRKQKEWISCSDVTKQFSQFPVKFDEITNADSCGSIHTVIPSKEKLIFSADGVIVKIGKKEDKTSLMRPLKDREVSMQQIVYEDTTISVCYSAKQQKDSTDIYARFMLEVDGYVIHGDIRGIYTERSKASVNDLPDEVFDQTESRILKFLDTYIVL